jgi:alpha-L-fucosidase
MNRLDKRHLTNRTTHTAAKAVLLAGAIIAAQGSVPMRTSPPAPFGALPSPRQLEHAKLETYAFVHFTVNTFTDREWGLGNEDESVFSPTNFDPDQIVLSLKAAGMKGVILTCKHHDGFCLWPTATTTHSVARSSWMGGKGDVVKSISEACRRHGMKFGVYVSPWDRNSAKYGKPEYIAMYRAQLTELLTHYGPIFEVWLDGANGGTGYYGGANENRSIDRRTFYDWPTTWALIRKLQPKVNVFSDIGPDLRWVGNEEGFAADTSWETYDAVGRDHDEAAPGYSDYQNAPTGTPLGTHWLPAECDVSIRPGWFWHASENENVKTPAQLFDLYAKSVGRGASLILNVPPDREGRIDEPDVKSLKAFGDVMRMTFQHNLADHAKATASSVRGEDAAYGPQNLVSTNPDRYWATGDGVTDGSVELDLGSAKTFDLIRLREPIQLGQRIQEFGVDAWKDGAWTEVAHGTSVGTCRIVRLDSPVTTSKVRLRITKSAAPVLAYGFGLYLEAPAAR